MGFSAATALPRLDWNFAPYIEARGVTPEPSRKKLDAFREDVQRLDRQRLTLTDQGRIRDEADLPDEDRERVKQLDYELAQVIADLTDGNPSLDQLTGLLDASPRAFFGYLNSLLEDLTNPEGSRSATTP